MFKSLSRDSLIMNPKIIFLITGMLIIYALTMIIEEKRNSNGIVRSLISSIFVIFFHVVSISFLVNSRGHEEGWGFIFFVLYWGIAWLIAEIINFEAIILYKKNKESKSVTRKILHVLNIINGIILIIIVFLIIMFILTAIYFSN